MGRLWKFQVFFLVFNVLNLILSVNSEAQSHSNDTFNPNNITAEPIKRVKRQYRDLLCPGHDGLAGSVYEGFVPWHAEIYHLLVKG